MRKEYETPDFELTKLNFESILEEHYIEHSKGEGLPMAVTKVRTKSF